MQAGAGSVWTWFNKKKQDRWQLILNTSSQRCVKEPLSGRKSDSWEENAPCGGADRGGPAGTKAGLRAADSADTLIQFSCYFSQKQTNQSSLVIIFSIWNVSAGAQTGVCLWIRTLAPAQEAKTVWQEPVI